MAALGSSADGFAGRAPAADSGEPGVLSVEAKGSAAVTAEPGPGWFVFSDWSASHGGDPHPVGGLCVDVGVNEAGRGYLVTVEVLRRNGKATHRLRWLWADELLTDVCVEASPYQLVGKVRALCRVLADRGSWSDEDRELLGWVNALAAMIGGGA